MTRLLFLLIFTLSSQLTESCAYDLGGDTNISSISGLSSATALDFTGNATLSVNASSDIGAITKSISVSNALVNFTGDNRLGIFGNVGQINGITTSTNNTGTISFNGSSSQNIDSSIGSVVNRFKSIIANNSSEVNFQRSVYTKDFSANGLVKANSNLNIAGSILGFNKINGSGSISLDGDSSQTVSSQIGDSASKFNSLNIDNNAITDTVKLLGNLYLQNLYVTNGKSTVGSRNSLSDIDTLTVLSGKTINFVDGVNKINSVSNTGNILLTGSVDIQGSVSGSGIIRGSVNEAGNLILSGNSSQTISNNLGESTNKLATITINNTDTIVGVQINNDINSKGLLLNNGSKTSIASANLNVNDGVTSSGNAELIFNSSVSQTANAAIGKVNNLINKITVNNSSGVIFKDNVFVRDISGNASSFAAIDTGKSLNISGNATGTSSVIKGAGSGGDVNFSGTSAQNIEFKIGANTLAERLNQIGVSNSNAVVTLNNDAFTKNVNLASNSRLAIASGRTVDITGDITGGGKLQGTSIAGSGLVRFSGLSNQNIAAGVGSLDNKIDTVNIANTSGSAIVTFNNALNANNLIVNSKMASNNTIANQNFNISSTITGDASLSELSFTGDKAQNIQALVGVGVDSRFGTIKTTNTGGLAFSNNLYVTDFVVDGGVNFSGTNIDVKNGVTTSTANGAVTFSGPSSNQVVRGSIGTSTNKLSAIVASNSSSTGTTFESNLHANSFSVIGNSTLKADNSSFGVVSVASNKNLNLDGNLITMGDVNNSGNLIISSDKSVNITGNLSGSGLFYSQSGLGNVNFSGTGTKLINSSIGTVSNRINIISVSNPGETIFYKNIVANNLNISGGGVVTIDNTNSGGAASVNITNGITSNNPDSGEIRFSGNTLQTVTSSIGSELSKLNNIRITNQSGVALGGNVNANYLILGNNSKLDLSGNTINLTNGISNFANNNGELTFSGAVSQNIAFGIGSSVSSLNLIKVNNTNSNGTKFSSAVNANSFSIGNAAIADIATDNFNIGNGGIIAQSDGSGKIIFSGSLNQTLSAQVGSSTLKLGTVEINKLDTSNLVLSSNVWANNLLLTSGNSTIADNKSLNIYGNISGSATLKGANSSGAGNLNFNGTTTQNISSAIGTLSNRLANINVNNSSVTGVNLNENIYSRNLTLTSGLGNIAATKTIDITGDITGIGTIQGATNDINGIGNLTLSGSTLQNINSTIGSVNKLATIKVDNTSNAGARFSAGVYANNFVIGTNGIADLATNNLNLGTDGITAQTNGSGKIILSSSVAQNVTYKIGSSSNKLGTIEVRNSNANDTTFDNTSGATTIYANNLLVNSKTILNKDNASDVFDLASVNLGTSKELVINNLAASGTLNIANINGSGTLSLNGSASQDISAVAIGQTTRLKQLNINNTAGITLGDTLTENLVANNSLTIATSKTVDVSGAITGSSVLRGPGNLTLSGSSLQNISTIGELANSLTNINVRNTVGAQFNGDIYATNLNLDQSGKAIIKGSNINVTNIVTTANNTGEVEFGGVNSQVVNANIGSVGFKIANLKINKDNDLTDTELKKNIIAANLQIIRGKTTINNLTSGTVIDSIAISDGQDLEIKNIGGTIAKINGSGSLIFSGTALQNVSSLIGGVSANDRLNNLWLNNLGGVNFASNVFARNLILDQGFNQIASGATLDISEHVSGSSVLRGPGNLTLSGSSLQNISTIGELANSLTNINVRNTVGAQFNGDIYATNLNLDQSGKAIIKGSNINVTNIVTTANNTGEVEFGGTTTQNISSAIGTLSNRLANINVNNSSVTGVNLNENIYSRNLTLTSGLGNIAATKTIDITGDITGIGTIQGATNDINGIGNLTLSGSTLQNINSTIGSVNKLATIKVDNTSNAGARFSAGVYANNFVIGTNGIADLATNNLNLGTDGITAQTNGSGKIILSSSVAQNVTYKIGSSSNKLGTIEVRNSNANDTTFDNTSGATTIYANNLLVNSKTILNKDNASDVFDLASVNLGTSKELVINNLAASGTLNIANINGSGTLSLNGSASQDISAVAIGQTTRLKQLNINNTAGITLGDTLTENLVANNSLTIATSKTVDVSGAITGSSVLRGPGNLTLSGSSLQNISTIGELANSLTNINVRNTVGAQFNGDIYATNLNLDQSGKAIIKGSNINVTNIVTTANNTGEVEFGGTTTQNISSAIGTLSNRLANINVNNSSVTGVNLNENIYSRNLTLTSGLGNIAATKTIDITGDITGIGTCIQGATNGVGAINFSGSGIQNVSSNLGSVNNRLNSINLSAASATIFSGSSSIFTNNLNIDGKVVFNNNGLNSFETVTNNNHLTVNAGSVIGVSNSANLSASSKFNVGFDTSNGAIGRLNGTSAAVTIGDHSNLNFVYSYLTGGTLGSFDPGKDYAFLDYDSLNFDQTKLVVTDNSALVKSSVKNDTVNKKLLLHNELDPVTVSSIGSSSSNEVKNLNSIFSSGIATDVQLNLVRAELIRIDAVNLANAIKTLSLPKNNMLVTSSNNITSKVNNLLNSRMSAVSASKIGFATGNNQPSEKGSWGQLYNGYSSQKQVADFDGYKSNFTGFMFGFDTVINTSLIPNSSGKTKSLAGVAIGYGNAGVKAKDAAKSTTDIQSYQLAFYNNNHQENGVGFYNENIVNLAYNRYGNKRTINIASPKTVDADFDSTQYGFKTGFGYNFYLDKKFLVAPNASLAYSRLDQDSYQESGAGNVGLQVKSKSFDSLTSDLGVKILGKTILETGLVYYPELNLSWLHNLKTQGQESQVSFIGGGDSIIVNGPAMPRDLLNIGGELNFVNSKNSYITLKYDFQTGSGYTSHTGYVKYRLSF